MYISFETHKILSKWSSIYSATKYRIYFHVLCVVFFFFVLLRKWFLISIRIPFSISKTLARAEKKNGFGIESKRSGRVIPRKKLILKSLCAQLHMVFSQKKNKINYFQWTEWKSIKCFYWHYWFSLQKHVNHCIDVVLNIKLASSSLFFFILCYPSFILRHPWWKIDFGWFEICFNFVFVVAPFSHFMFPYMLNL